MASLAIVNQSSSVGGRKSSRRLIVRIGTVELSVRGIGLHRLPKPFRIALGLGDDCVRPNQGGQAHGDDRQLGQPVTESDTEPHRPTSLLPPSHPQGQRRTVRARGQLDGETTNSAQRNFPGPSPGLTFLAGVVDLNLSIDFSMDALSAGSLLLSPEPPLVAPVVESEHPPSGRRPASMAIT